MPKLGVNIDHVATLRQARDGNTPDPVYAAFLARCAGADSIVAHLREDRRHIQDRDIKLLSKDIGGAFNLEMSIAPEILEIACRIRPHQATLVPEKRKELTTEGGLDVVKRFNPVSRAVKKLKNRGIRVSLFIDPDEEQIEAAFRSEAKIIELHTGRYSLAEPAKEKNKFFRQLVNSTRYARTRGLTVNAGHGLDYANAGQVAGIEGIYELNIGYSIICKSVYIGLPEAVRQMRKLIR